MNILTDLHIEVAWHLHETHVGLVYKLSAMLIIAGYFKLSYLSLATKLSSINAIDVYVQQVTDKGSIFIDKRVIKKAYILDDLFHSSC